MSQAVCRRVGFPEWSCLSGWCMKPYEAEDAVENQVS
jgi:hypothetical protein